MKTFAALNTLFLFLALALSLRAADQFLWWGDLERARALAAAGNQPMLVVFRCEP